MTSRCIYGVIFVWLLRKLWNLPSIKTFENQIMQDYIMKSCELKLGEHTKIIELIKLSNMSYSSSLQTQPLPRYDFFKLLPLFGHCDLDLWPMTKLLLSPMDFITVLMWQEDEMQTPNSYRENGSRKTSTDTQTHRHPNEATYDENHHRWFSS